MGGVRAAVAAVLVSLVLGPAAAAAAEPLPKPQGVVVLEVTGKIANTNAGAAAAFDIAAIERIGVSSFTTATPWTDGKVTFEGVSGDRLMATLEADGTEIRAEALDGYSVVIPMEDFRRGGAIIAYKMNGAPLAEGEQGPLWIVYPYDADPGVNDEEHHARSIWQLKSLEIR
ncbi:MAG TPA: molybdopterin-dependent oxidoreductase [Dongiaceae bacterium]|nr:molybdopterin-dependent oxidoreductase [Dongiaceae bacterium]